MENIKKKIKTEKIKYTAFSSITVFFIMGILIIINLLANRFNLSFDLSKDKLYSISNTSKEIISELDRDINIYAIFPEESNDSYMDVCREILMDYSKNSPKITVSFKDPIIYPNFINKYSTREKDVEIGSVIVESGVKFKVISLEELRTVRFNMRTGTNELISIDIEPQVTNALRYVMGETPLIYRVSNHNEISLTENLKKQIEMSNYKIHDLDLFKDEIKEDTAMLFITTPYMDWTPQEADKVTNYLNNGGRAMFFTDIQTIGLPNYENVLTSYGVIPGGFLLVEGDSENTKENPLNIIPSYANGEILETFDKSYKLLIPYVQSIKELALKRKTINVEPVLISSKYSYEKSSLNPQSGSKELGDNEGPFTLATGITDYSFNFKTEGATTKIFVVGSTLILDETANIMVSNGNYRFIVDAINWTQDIKDAIYIAPKTTGVSYLEMNDKQILIVAGFSFFVLPGIIFGIGVVVWTKRRNG